MSDKTDNELLEEILFHTKETRKSISKVQGNTLVVAIAVILSAVASIAAMSSVM